MNYDGHGNLYNPNIPVNEQGRDYDYGVGPPIGTVGEEKKSSMFSGFKIPSFFGSSNQEQSKCINTCKLQFPNKSGGRKSRRRKNKKNKRKSFRRKK